MVKQPVRVRIAPSPTGLLHIGIARTALFNWIFAKKNGGFFIVRIEDTDTARSAENYEKNILENLEWLGIEWDEGPVLETSDKKQETREKGSYGPYRQSKRTEIYEKYIKKLLDEKLGFYCFCTKEELESERQGMLSQGLPPKYSGRCRNLDTEEVAQKLNSGISSVIRFKMPDAKINFNDTIRGKITFDMSLIGDIAIARDTKSPLYNLAVAIDDFEMKITHVIRGEDHLANTPKQIMLQNALGFNAVQYAHLPLILSPDRSKMSKRFEAATISEYRDNGYLPEAIINFIALIGWHAQAETDPVTGKIYEHEILSMNELVEKFELARVQKGGASFNAQKLDWINSQYIKNLGNEELLSKIRNIIPLPEGITQNKLIKIIGIVKERMKKLTDFSELAGFFFTITDYQPEMLKWKDTPDEQTLNNLTELANTLEDKDSKEFTREKLENVINPLAEKKGRGEIFWPLRVALSGKEASPGPLEIMDILGKKESIKRLNIAILKLKSSKQQIF